MAGDSDQPVKRPRSPRTAIGAAVAVLILIPVAFVLLIVGATSGAGATRVCGGQVPTTPVTFQGDNDVPGEGVPPQNFIRAYFAAASQPDAKLGFELGPYVLMAIHEIESSFGRSNLEGVKSGINHVGDVSCCKGPFQFFDLPGRSTWLSKSPIGGRTYARDGDGDGDVDIYSNFDSMFAAAAYLHASGAPGDWHAAVYSYNHADSYVNEVLTRAREFQATIRPPTESEPLEPPATQDVDISGEGAPANSMVVGATRFGGPSDGQANRRGYAGDLLEGTAAFAELGYAPGTNESNARTGLLGNLPYGTHLRITYKEKAVEAVKLDVAEGGGAVQGTPRAIGLWWQLADQLGLKKDDRVSVQRLDGGALPQPQRGDTQNAPSSPECGAPEGVEQVVNAPDGGPYQAPLASGTYSVTGRFWEQRESYRHEGTDLAADTGTPIWAAGAGKVVVAGWVGGYGRYTCVQHAQMLTSCYGHQSSISVAVGDTVQRGQEIGKVGNTGESTGPHLHFEMRAGPDSEAPPQCPANYVGIPPDQWCTGDSPGFNKPA